MCGLCGLLCSRKCWEVGNLSVVPDWDASCVRVWVSRALFLLCSCVQVCVCRLEGPFRVLSFGAWVGVSEHVCSVVLLALLLWRWMCLCLQSPPLSSVLFPLCAMVPTLLVGSVVVVPLSLPAISDCGGVVSPELGLSSPGTESVPVAPVELQDPTSCYCWCRDVGVCGVRSGPVVLVLAKRS